MAVFRLLGKTRALIIAVIVLDVLGNFFLSVGMREVGRLVVLSPLPYLLALLNPWVAFGCALLAGWIAMHLVLLSRADLSYVLPVTAVSYVFTALMGDVFLREAVSASRWAGVALITAGVMAVSRTRPRTTPRLRHGELIRPASGAD
ncbi:MAG: hypothetical protein ACM3S5_02515 [Rhodospirillales bacterium]